MTDKRSDELIATVVKELKLIREVGLDPLLLERVALQVPRTAELSFLEDSGNDIVRLEAAESIVRALKLVCKSLGKDEISHYARMLFRQTKETADLTPAAARRRTMELRRVQLRQFKNKYEPVVLEKVAQKLVEGEWRTDALASSTPSSELVTPEAPGGYIIENFDISYRFRDGQVAGKVVCSCILRAVEDGVSAYETHTTYLADRRPDVMDVEALDGCEVDEDASCYAHGYQKISFALPYKLSKGETHRLWYIKTIDSSKPARPFYGISRDHSIKTLRLEIQFADNAWPRSIWRFDKIAAHQVPGEMSTECAVSLNHRGHAKENFANLRPGFFSGLGWSWDSE